MSEPSNDLVILVDRDDRQLGTEGKLRAHQDGGRLHRAVSVLIVDPEGRVLLQRRSAAKYHFGGLWGNTCCTHPGPSEGNPEAAERRLFEEMGIRTGLTEVAQFVYRATDPSSGLTEHEFDHIFMGLYDGEPHPNPAEVEEWEWVDPVRLRADLEANPERYSPWLSPMLDQVASLLGDGSAASRPSFRGSPAQRLEE